LTLTTDIIEVFLKHLTDRIALAIFLLSLISLGLMWDNGQVGIWMRGHWTWALLGGLGSLCYLPTRMIQEKTAAWGSERKRHQRLHRLTKIEKQLLRPYVEHDERSQLFFNSNAEAAGLADDGILYCPAVPSDQFERRAYNIQD
jgi:hypothetical protein